MNNIIGFLGVDLCGPKNEMLANLVDDVIAHLPNDYHSVKISIQKKKHFRFSSEIWTIPKVPLITVPFQAFCIFISLLLFYLKGGRRLNIVWSGFGVFDDLVVRFCKVLGIKSIYTITSNKQLEYWSASSADSIVFFDPDLEARIENKNKYNVLPVPDIFIENSENSRDIDILFVTVPFAVKDVYKRGINLLIEIIENLNNQRIPLIVTILSRSPILSSYIQKECSNRNLENYRLIDESVDDMVSYYKSSKCLLNLDRGSGSPSFPISIVESLMSGCPVILTKDSWLGKKISNSKSGRIVKFHSQEVIENIQHIISNNIYYSRQSLKLAKEVFIRTLFVKGYINSILNCK